MKTKELFSKAFCSGRAFFLAISLLVIGVTVWAQSPDSVYTSVDRMPRFKGTPSRTAAFIKSQLVYPDEAWLQSKEGVVEVSFTVTRDGRLMDAKVESGIDPLMDLEALRVVELMQDWRPAKKNGVEVHARVHVPVEFSMSEDERAFVDNLQRLNLTDKPPLFVLDNKIVQSRVHLPEYNLKSLRVLKGEVAVEAYGEAGRNGVVVMESKRGTPPVR
ncbi:energy transducer TonB [Geofilum rhodophaeum]|uniref:energy transducer TonB n=1 Tax=Geofilum rhodophaeum TaxID=1965019 RepID=UPI00197A9C83|nr:energy transducer TonB [Geofilum rhodophaeum]